ncbi:hypothetical protein GOP47_0028139 [Adiantum capillus-veneris]|nr:hypothetical protein GOP47_0028139 [Adiantum capillus-veneris]
MKLSRPFVPDIDLLSMRAKYIIHPMQLLWRRPSIKPFILHLFTSLLLLGSLASGINYLSFKIRLYYRELPAALAAPWLLLLLACELIYFLCTLVAAVDFFLPPMIAPALTPLASEEHDDNIKMDFPQEPTDVPQESILAALSLHYPKGCFKILVLDDGADDNLKVFCETMQVESGSDQLLYLRRTKIPGVPHHFKCGNMNFGLQHSDAEYVVMMDADMILHPSFLLRVLPHIVNAPDVSFVQVPQSFYNLPVGDPLNDACAFGYDRAMVHRNTLGCAPCVGTGAIFRRKHLDEIGGFQPQSITEDTMTAYMLFNQGYKSVYINEKLQIGITPWTFEGFIKQRERWGKGAIQQLVSTWKMMLGNGSKLNMFQKSFYFWHTGYYYMSILNVMIVLILWSSLAFRLNFVLGDEVDNRTLLSNLAIYFLSWKIFWYVLWLEVPQPIQSRNRDESQFWWMAPFFFKMVLEAAFCYKSTFKFVPTSTVDRSAAATVKSSPLMRKLNELKLVRVHIAFIILCGTTVLARAYPTLAGYVTFTRELGFHKSRCDKGMAVVIGLSVFLLSTCAHMSVPVLHLLMPTGFRPEQRKCLLHFNFKGVPIFEPVNFGPKWHPSTIFFELVSLLNIAFWLGIYISAVHPHAFTVFCANSSISH